MSWDIMDRVNKEMRRRHINQCKKCKFIYDNDFCTVFQKDIKNTSFECDGSEEVISTLL